MTTIGNNNITPRAFRVAARSGRLMRVRATRPRRSHRVRVPVCAVRSPPRSRPRRLRRWWGSHTGRARKIYNNIFFFFFLPSVLIAPWDGRRPRAGGPRDPERPPVRQSRAGAQIDIERRAHSSGRYVPSAAAGRDTHTRARALAHAARPGRRRTVRRAL